MPSRSKPSKPSKPRKRSDARSGRRKPPSVPRPAEYGGPLPVVRQRSLADWPVHEALANGDWNDPHALAVVIVVRRHPRYEALAIGTFMVDLQCLGVKDANYFRIRDRFTYDRRARPHLLDRMPPMVPVEPALAAKIVAEGLAYAASLGFEPHPDFQAARAVLDGLDPADDPTPVHLGGEDGKPHYVSGPYDDPMAILTHLKDRVGQDGYHATLVLGDPFDEDPDAPDLFDALGYTDDDTGEDDDLDDDLDDDGQGDAAAPPAEPKDDPPPPTRSSWT